MTRGDTGSQGENTGVDKEWSGEEEVVLCVGSWPFKTPPRTQKHTLSMLACPEFAAVEFNSFSTLLFSFLHSSIWDKKNHPLVLCRRVK